MLLRTSIYQRALEAMSYADYCRVLAQKASETNRDAQLSSTDPHAPYLRLNQYRTVRSEKTCIIDRALANAVCAITAPQVWLVITEPWCGDSAQCLPQIAKIAACNPLISLRILLRDRNLDIMDLYLTQGARSVPKLIAFSAAATELFQWGPRPSPAAELFRRERLAGTDETRIHDKLNLWYAKDQGRTLQQEFLKSLTAPQRRKVAAARLRASAGAPAAAV
jgi:hypothetical protein